MKREDDETSVVTKEWIKEGITNISHPFSR